MNLKNKALSIFVNIIPIIVMIALIPVFKNDYILSGVYILMITSLFAVKYRKNDYIFFLFGFFGMIASEYFFISTGVETFNRNTFLGLMPLWLPLLWGYSFVAMRRAVTILDY